MKYWYKACLTNRKWIMDKKRQNIRCDTCMIDINLQLFNLFSQFVILILNRRGHCIQCSRDIGIISSD